LPPGFLEVSQGKPGDRLAVAREHCLERRDVLELRFFFDHRRDTFEAVEHLRVHRMLDPERAVLIEDGNRSSAGTWSGLAVSVVVRTKSRIARFAAPSFHEGNGFVDGVVCADAGIVRSGLDKAGNDVKIEIRTRRFTDDGLMVLS
jgi:hypothetical protein